MAEHIEINNSKREDYSKQTNNEIDPYISCFPTSMINAAYVVNAPIPTDEAKRNGYKQDEDAYNWYLSNNPDCVAFWKRPEFAAYVSNPENHPRELYGVEEYCFNKWVGKDVCELEYGIDFQKVIDVIVNGGAAVTSGKFCGFGHVICIVGLKAEAEDPKNIKLSEVTHIIVDDSYGNPHKNYKPSGVDGNDVEWEKDAFLSAINKGKQESPTYNAILFRKEVA